MRRGFEWRSSAAWHISIAGQHCLPSFSIILSRSNMLRRATKVLVLDNSLRGLPDVDKLSPEQTGLRILCSPWARRLWTLQESGLLMRVHFLIGNTMPSYPEIRLSLKNSPNLATVFQQIPDDHVLRPLIARTHDLNLTTESFTGHWKQRFHRDRFIDGALSPTWSRLEAWFDTLYMNWGMATTSGRVPVFRGVAYRSVGYGKAKVSPCKS